ncbi:NAD-dependent epimerase/dehydratase family protein [Fulvivirga lutea]|uniref:NAD-dependent epimerase/dehydratase family protein n=1 Tax=Fulvivirga lutea TaxID=2810512 RepID=A0A974WF78_9BACT|nr:NAD-dependent epimerase/dehydratase family protein [Fulvivirga lutea]QSE97364.1 NAD-dependent epimerase/dehydratase family protein [Fulvivirga lutea]
MKVIITGATGMVGKGVLLECLDHPEISEVLLINRRQISIKHEKIKEIIHQDFGNYDSIKDQLAGYDAAYLCMGISAAGLSEAKYKEITYDYTLALAKVLYNHNANMTITYVSGQGTDSSEKGRTMWARVKGKTENDLLNMGFKQAFMYRPGAIIPLKGIKSGTRLYQFFYDYFMWLIKLLKFLFPKSIVNTTQLGQSMINVTRSGYEKNILKPSDILRTSK